jgi:hypothetical protein
LFFLLLFPDPLSSPFPSSNGFVVASPVHATVELRTVSY